MAANEIIGGSKVTREELLSKARELKNLTAEMYDEGILDASTTHEGNIHCTEHTFLKLIGNSEYKISKRSTKDYPLRISANVGGMEVFAIGTQNEIDFLEREIKRAQEENQ